MKLAADLKVLSEADECFQDDMPEGERGDAELRRAALVVTATDIIDYCTDDIEMVVFDDDAGRADVDPAEESFIWKTLPARHPHPYGQEFHRKVLVTVLQVASDLAGPHDGYAACTEEVIRHAVGRLGIRLRWKTPAPSPGISSSTPPAFSTVETAAMARAGDLHRASRMLAVTTDHCGHRRCRPPPSVKPCVGGDLRGTSCRWRHDAAYSRRFWNFYSNTT